MTRIVPSLSHFHGKPVSAVIFNPPEDEFWVTIEFAESGVQIADSEMLVAGGDIENIVGKTFMMSSVSNTSLEMTFGKAKPRSVSLETTHVLTCDPLKVAIVVDGVTTWPYDPEPFDPQTPPDPSAERTMEEPEVEFPGMPGEEE